MELLLYASLLLALAFACAVLLVGYPTLMKAVGLALLRHGRTQERRQAVIAERLSEALCRELER